MSETDEQIKVVQWLEHNKVLFLHVPNEGKKAVQYAVKLKQMGVKKGAPDLLIFDELPDKPYVRGIAIEMKNKWENKPSKVSKEQEEWKANLSSRRWISEVCYGAEEAIGFLKILLKKNKPLTKL